jgi:CAAX protease family protein
MPTLILLTLLPLVVIAVQLGSGATGWLGYTPYKFALLVPPLIYCRVTRISVRHDILKLQNWRRGLKRSVVLGVTAIAIFWGTYYALADRLLDKAVIGEKIGERFHVTAENVYWVAPLTIFFNSFLEEFFYRGFAFGLLVRRNAWVGYLAPAAAFTVQHLAFTYHWAGWAPIAMGVVALLVFSLVLQKIYAVTDTLVAPWLIHMFGDVAMMGIAVTLLR